EKKTINPQVVSNVVMDNSRFSIPKNAFLGQDGKPVSGPVRIEYREFMDPASIFLSGVPMKYDSAGSQYNFSSAGMFEFRAFDENNNELQPNPESQINMQLTSRTSRPEYSMYLFNETSNAWEIKDDNRDELDVVKDLEARNKFSTAMASNRSRLSGLF